MPDLILHDIQPALLDRMSRWADARGSSLEDALLDVLDRGLAGIAKPAGALDDRDVLVLEEAIAALERVPSDPGFALIGRAPVPGATTSRAPDQRIDANWAQPG